MSINLKWHRPKRFVSVVNICGDLIGEKEEIINDEIERVQKNGDAVFVDIKTIGEREAVLIFECLDEDIDDEEEEEKPRDKAELFKDMIDKMIETLDKFQKGE